MDEQNKINEENYGAKGMDEENPVLTLADILNEQEEMEEVCVYSILKLDMKNLAQFNSHSLNL